MGKREELIGEAKAITTDIMMTLNGTDFESPLKTSTYMAQVKDDIETLSANKGGSLLGRFKEAMLETEDDQKKARAEQNIIDNTYQLKNCLRCKCLNCAAMDQGCKCEGCLFGSFVVACDHDTETREADPGVLRLNEMPILKMEYNRSSKKAVVTVINHAGLEEKSTHDFQAERR